MAILAFAAQGIDFYYEEQVPGTVAPLFIGGITVDTIGLYGFNASFSLDRDCTAFIMVVPQGSTAPTAQQIITGASYTGGVSLFSSSGAASANVQLTFNVLGITGYEGQQVTAYITARDSDGNTQSADQIRSSTLSLQEINLPPTVTGNYPQQTVIVGQPFTFSASTNFSDTDTLTYSLNGLSGAVINEISGNITWTPAAINLYPATVTATDTAGQSVSAQLPVNVVAAPPANLRPTNRAIVWSDGKSPNFVIGDDFIQTVTLYYNTPSEVCNIVNASSVKVALVTDDHSMALTSVVDQSLSTVGASWSGGVVVISMGEAVTVEAAAEITKLTYCKLEIEVVLDGNSFTWFAPVRVIPGYID